MSTQTESRYSKPRLTHRQIATQLGVSRQLVGFALRGEGRMSSDMRRQILEVAEQHGYDQYSNGEARSLAARRYGKRVASGVIAVIFQSRFEGEPLSMVPFFTPIFAGLETGAVDQGIDLVLCPLRFGQLPRLVRENLVDGVICISTPREDTERLKNTGLPIVNVLEVMGATDCDLNLGIDNERGVALSVKHLLELGHRRIAYLGANISLSADRLNVFRRELTPLGAMDESLVMLADCQLTTSAGATLMQRFLAEQGIEHKSKSPKPLPFSGLMAFNDLMALGAIQALQAAGYGVPEDVSVVGFDDVAPLYNASPSLTSVWFSRRDIGRRAIEFLCQPIQDKTGPIYEIFPVEFVPRDSTRPFRFNEAEN